MSARYMQPLRILTQFSFLAFMVWLAFCFYNFVQAVTTPMGVVSAARPDGIDGFLPISGLLGTASWIRGDGINSIHPAAVVIFLTVGTVSLLLRRSFCSWICPIAALSECTWKAGFRVSRRSWRLPAKLDRALRSLKYVLMAFFIFSIAIAMDSNALLQFIHSDYHKIADVRLMNFFFAHVTCCIWCYSDHCFEFACAAQPALSLPLSVWGTAWPDSTIIATPHNTEF